MVFDSKTCVFFCKEFAPAQKRPKTRRKSKKQQQKSVNNNISFDESYFDNINIQSVVENVNNNVNVKPPDQFLCWICGDIFGSNDLLVQHASNLHFYDWMAANSYWELSDNSMLRFD